MARPRKVSDEDVFAAVVRAMSRLGPGELTLGEIAAEAGLTAGALVQRFGSKRALLLATSTRWAGSASELFADLRARHPSPFDALREYARCMAGLASTPAAFIRNLAYLQIDLADEELRKPLAAHARGTRRAIEELVARAIEAGELAAEVDAAALARTIETILSGSLMTWACHRAGDATDWILADLEAVLQPYRTSRDQH